MAISPSLRLVQSLGTDFQTVRSPLRICPLGAHVDHQHGLVTAMALNEGLHFHYRPREDGVVSVRSGNFEGIEEFSFDDVPREDRKSWGAYLRGAVLSLQRDFTLKRGLEGVIEGRIPTGGLSSSAAVCTAYLTALADVNEISLAPLELVSYAHWIEREYIGLKNGILDHAANVLSKEQALLLLDCEDHSYEHVPQPESMEEFCFLLVYSGVSKSLITTGYNNRVDECRAAAWFLAEAAGTLDGRPLNEMTLRAVGEDVFHTYKHILPGRFRRRAEHFFSECERVRQGVEAWRAGDLKRFGQLMNESGQSSIENYESGCPELIALYEILRECPGVYGTRFSGAGFRGFCIALIDPARVADIEGRVREEYPKRFPERAKDLQIYTCSSDNGVEIVR